MAVGKDWGEFTVAQRLGTAELSGARARVAMAALEWVCVPSVLLEP